MTDTGSTGPSLVAYSGPAAQNRALSQGFSIHPSNSKAFNPLLPPEAVNWSSGGQGSNHIPEEQVNLIWPSIEGDMISITTGTPAPKQSSIKTLVGMADDPRIWEEPPSPSGFDVGSHLVVGKRLAQDHVISSPVGGGSQVTPAGVASSAIRGGESFTRGDYGPSITREQESNTPEDVGHSVIGEGEHVTPGGLVPVPLIVGGREPNFAHLEDQTGQSVDSGILGNPSHSFDGFGGDIFVVSWSNFQESRIGPND
jgi:hypothetical protein